MSYTATTSGFPCWYELGTSDLDGAAAFYESVLGWTVVSAGMPELDYRLGNAPDGFGIAGLMDAEGAPSAWRFYLEVADCDAAAATVTETGGSIIMPPADIPGTGRFAVAVDPQGAVFALLAPAPMGGEAPSVGAYAPALLGHGAWHELSTPDIEGSLAFYGNLVGWTKGVTMDMGADGSYQLVQAQGTDVGGMMVMGSEQGTAWLSYFTVDSTAGAVERIKAGGGSVLHGPAEVPGGAFIAIAVDPQGAAFGVTGPQ